MSQQSSTQDEKLPSTDSEPRPEENEKEDDFADDDFAGFNESTPTSKPTTDKAAAESFDFGGFDDFPAKGNSATKTNDFAFGDFDEAPQTTAQNQGGPTQTSTDSNFDSFADFGEAPAKSTAGFDADFDAFGSAAPVANDGFSSFQADFDFPSTALQVSSDKTDATITTTATAATTATSSTMASTNSNTPAANPPAPEASTAPLRSLSEIQEALLEKYSSHLSLARNQTPTGDPSANAGKASSNSAKSGSDDAAPSGRISLFQPLQDYARSTGRERNDPDGLQDRLRIDRKNYAQSLYSAINSTSNEPVFRYKWHKTNVRRKHADLKEELMKLQ